MTNLISGKDALIALANGGEVQWMTGDCFQDVTDEWQLREFSHPSFKFRLKPRTITINGIEVPAPFEPKEGEYFWYISDEYATGYSCNTKDSFLGDIRLGAWRTEDEIKQVVAALRQVFGGLESAKKELQRQSILRWINPETERLRVAITDVESCMEVSSESS